MTTMSEAAEAERLSRRRGRILPMLTLLFLIQQASFFSQLGQGDTPIDHVKISAWMVMSLLLVLMLYTGGGWFHSRRVRELANDESTRAFRQSALNLGFLMTMLAALAVALVSMVQPIGPREAVQVIVSVGVVTAMLRFAFLERRAQRDG
ncbi:hypothetical protein H8M03_09810 [Sphingomonas sabuli]|uniref:Uncharacterized protein n=1 Tax=Sphingomonas sabuli TaxID=2764186 RepID=A0A7G9L107_9SPHN|nr:hypothetical protein [Sphingomonas sabuli]QNM82306.1 hypothetical protein H8M03_09810 [Sphingomonas sabuli]